MIRPLRNAHRAAIAALAATLPALLIMVLLQRPPQVPDGAMAGSSPTVRVLEQAGGKRRLEIALPENLPEVLAYWAPVGSATVDAHAVLIGRPERAHTLLTIPDGLPTGQLLLFSPPLNKILVQQPFAAGASP